MIVVNAFRGFTRHRIAESSDSSLKFAFATDNGGLEDIDRIIPTRKTAWILTGKID